MTMELNLEVTGREVIKPSSPAPVQRLDLSMFDLGSPSVYVPTTLFYKSSTGETSDIISSRLKNSLSETLSRFYPLAGRIEGHSISCNDEGVVFLEARTDILLQDYLRNFTADSLKEIFPSNEEGESPGTWPLMRVKVNFFGAGSGFAVSVGISHLVCDAASVLNFVQGWAATAKGDENISVNPKFAGATIYPLPHSSFQAPSIDDILDHGGKIVLNRFVFKSFKIAQLKDKAASESVTEPTRVEAISSLIWRCARNASRSKYPAAAAKPTIMIQPIDLRGRVSSDVLSSDSIGNLTSLFYLKRGAESTMEIEDIVAECRKAKEGFNKMIEEDAASSSVANITLGQKLLIAVGGLMAESKLDIDFYPISSWCKRDFYKVDFGWNTPVWMAPVVSTNYEKMTLVILIDSKDGEDVEAWVSLPEQDMHVFERDLDLLNYAVVNPPVLI